MAGRLRSAKQSSCVRRPGDEGVALVEFAIASLLLFTIIFGTIEFGHSFNNAQAVRQGVREGARQGAVLNFGTTTDCGLTGLSGSPSQDIQRLMCLTKNQIGLGNQTRVRVMIADPYLTSRQSSPFTQGQGLVVCAMTPLKSLTGMFAPFLDHRALTSRTMMRIEQTAPAPLQDGQEAPLPGQTWNWCTVTGGAP